MNKVRTLNSLADLGKVWGITPKSSKSQSRKCFKCGKEMHLIEGTNVFICTGTTKGKDGKEKQCMNRLIVGAKGA